MKSEEEKRIQKFDAFEIIYLIYLAMLPAAGTIFLLHRIHVPEWSRFFVFILGVAALGLYLATIVSYTIIPSSLWKRILFFLDGPFIAVGLALYLNGSITDILMNIFFIDVGGSVLGVFLTVIKAAPSKEDRIKGIIATGFPSMLILVSLFLYSIKDPEFSILQLIILILGLIHTGFIQSCIYKKDKVIRECPQIIILGIAFWLASYIFGCVFWDIQRKKKEKNKNPAVNIELSTSNEKKKN